MTHLVARSQQNSENILCSQGNRRTVVAKSHIVQEESNVQLNCTVKRLKVDGRPVLLSRVVYDIPQTRAQTGEEALSCAANLNSLLTYSESFIVQVNSRYRLHVDTLLFTPFNSKSIAQFLDCVQQDASVLIEYFSVK